METEAQKCEAMNSGQGQQTSVLILLGFLRRYFSQCLCENSFLGFCLLSPLLSVSVCAKMIIDLCYGLGLLRTR